MSEIVIYGQEFSTTFGLGPLIDLVRAKILSKHLISKVLALVICGRYGIPNILYYIYNNYMIHIGLQKFF